MKTLKFCVEQIRVRKIENFVWIKKISKEICTKLEILKKKLFHRNAVASD